MTNRQRTFGIAALVIVFAMALLWLRFSPGNPPPGQGPLVTLDAGALQRLRADFNRYAKQPRLIVLLSPT